VRLENHPRLRVKADWIESKGVETRAGYHFVKRFEQVNFQPLNREMRLNDEKISINRGFDSLIGKKNTKKHMDKFLLKTENARRERNVKRKT